VSDFARRLLSWFDEHGRHDLPWQHNLTPFSVWVSEIMLQQTQVATVIPYYERFMSAFPNVRMLADAPLDRVLEHWAGLGYYARGRNLHRAAIIVRDEHAGQFPQSFDELTALPGIGRSTAGAILAIACGQRHAILDGNVKRVLTRWRGIAEWPGKPAVAAQLWELAAELTPNDRVGPYTQAIMDLGATLCARTKPRCDACPVNDACVARREGLQRVLPAARPKRVKPQRKVAMLVIRNSSGAVLLERRPELGIWGGLYSLPELPAELAPEDWSRTQIGATLREVTPLAPLKHSFTHFELEIEPLSAALDESCGAVMDRDGLVWYKRDASERIGMPAPIAKLLDSLRPAAEGTS
jgi:A/G-specific adenine glycosylase